jgi:hypothetical protein
LGPGKSSIHRLYSIVSCRAGRGSQLVLDSARALKLAVA